MFCLYKNYFSLLKNIYFYKNLNMDLTVNCFLKYSSSLSLLNNFIFLSKISSNQNIINKNDSLLQFKYKNNYYYDFNVKNKFYFKKILNVFSSLLQNNFNFLILDLNYKTILPFYNFIFGLKNLYSNKNFFFLKKEGLSRPNWLYLYKSNIKRFNVGLLLLLDYFYFKNFLTVFKKFNIPLISIVPHKMETVYIDYFILSSYASIQLHKFLFFSFFSNLYFKFSFFHLLKTKYCFVKKLFLLQKIL